MSAVSFAADIKPLFRPVDVAHMKPHGVKLDDYQYMSDRRMIINTRRVSKIPFHLKTASRRRCLPVGRILDARSTGPFREMAQRRIPAVNSRDQAKNRVS
jgi:hypothetical protein